MTSASPPQLACAEPSPNNRSSSGLVRQYSPERVEGFVRETNLCLNCRAIFGLKRVWKKLGPPDWSESTGLYEHHPSVDSLQRSAEAGCQLCIKVHNKWTAWALAQPEKWKAIHDQPILFEFEHYDRRSYRFLHFMNDMPGPRFFYKLIDKNGKGIFSPCHVANSTNIWPGSHISVYNSFFSPKLHSSRCRAG